MRSELTDTVAAIRRAYPDLLIRTIEQNTEGQYNDVLLINDELIFRFPRFAAGIEVLQDEVRILNHLRGRLSLPIPHPIFSQFDLERVGHVFMGYRRLTGEPLSNDLRSRIAVESVVAHMARLLATFLHELHTTPIGDLAQHLPFQDSPSEWAELYADIQTDLFSYMRPEAQTKVDRQFASFLEPVMNFERGGVCWANGAQSIPE